MDYQALIRSPNAAALFFLILQETENGKKEFAMSYTEMGQALGITRQQARWYLGVLEKSGFISIPHTSHTFSTHLTSYKLTSCSVSKNTSHTLSTHFKGDIFSGENLTIEQQRYNGWLKFCKEKCPYIAANIDQLTFEQFTKLRGRFGAAPMSEIIQQIENRKDLRKRYSSLYLTMFNWLKNNYEK